MSGKRFADWIARHPGTHLVCTVSRYGRSYWLIESRTGRWIGVGE